MLRKLWIYLAFFALIALLGFGSFSDFIIGEWAIWFSVSMIAICLVIALMLFPPKSWSAVIAGLERKEPEEISEEKDDNSNEDNDNITNKKKAAKVKGKIKE